MLNSCHDIKIKFSLWSRPHILKTKFCGFFLNEGPAASVKIQICLYALQKNVPYSKCMIMHATQFIYGMYKYMY